MGSADHVSLDLEALRTSGNAGNSVVLFSDNIDEIEKFLRGNKNPDLEIKDKEGNTPLLKAISERRYEIVKLFIRCKADVHALGKNHSTPLHLAAKFDHHGVMIVSKLLDNTTAGDDICKEDANGDTPLHVAAHWGHTLRTLWPTYENYRLSHPGKAVNLENCLNFSTLLHYAAEKGSEDDVSFLIGRGAEIKVRNIDEETPFHFAARSGNTAVLELLKLDDIDIDDTGNAGWTALHYAASHRHNRAVRWLINKGAKAFASNRAKQLPIGILDENEDTQHICLLLKNLTEKSQTDDTKKIIDACHCDGPTLLHYAAGYGSKADVEWLIQLIIPSQCIIPPDEQRRIDHLLNRKDRANKNPLHWAAMRGNLNGLEALVKSKSKWTEEEDEKNQSPLSLALIHEQLPWADKLLLLLPAEYKQKRMSAAFKKWADDLKEKKSDLPWWTKIDMIKDEKIKPLFVAYYADRFDVAKLMLKHKEEDIQRLHWALLKEPRLHWALLKDKFMHMVTRLCEDTNAWKDNVLMALLEYAVEKELRDIVRELMQLPDVKTYLEELHRNRQAYIEAANAILVCAVLVASLTYPGWLHVPLDLKTTEEATKNVGVAVFWIFNGLSFLFSIATVMAGAGALLPRRYLFIAKLVSAIQKSLISAAVLLACSFASVVVAFLAAGYVVLASYSKYATFAGILFILTLVSYIIPLVKWRYNNWAPVISGP